jgi:hypothetical protein
VHDRLDAWRGDDFKVLQYAGLGKAPATSGCARCEHWGGAALARATRTTPQRGALLARKRFKVPLFERENLQKFE